jgi:hypothetical protein
MSFMPEADSSCIGGTPFLIAAQQSSIAAGTVDESIDHHNRLDTIQDQQGCPDGSLTALNTFGFQAFRQETSAVYQLQSRLIELGARLTVL